MSRRISSHPDLPLPPPAEELSFYFNGRPVRARKGDTVTAALLNSGESLFSRSFKYHRPRGACDLAGNGPETLVTVDGTPNVSADTMPVAGGMRVETQNAWPSVRWDAMSPSNWLIPLLPNQFYYKMFHKPRWAWPIFEKILRHSAGLGKIGGGGDDIHRRYEKRYRFPDVCVVGAGPAGLAAAQAALMEDKQVLLIDEEPELGGHSRHTVTPVEGCGDASLNGIPEYQAVSRLADSLRKHPRLDIFTGTNVFAVYEDNLVAAQRGRDLFKIRAGAVVLASGASDRHLVFQNNDKPGIMMSRGVEKLIALHAVRPGTRAVIVTTHPGGYHTAKILKGAGVEIVAIADGRAVLAGTAIEREIEGAGIPIFFSETIRAAHGFRRLSAVTLGNPTGTSGGRRVKCDLAVIAVGLMPRLGLLAMERSRPQWDGERQILRVRSLPPGMGAVGEVNGFAPFAQIYDEGLRCGRALSRGETPPESVRRPEHRITALPADIESGGSRHFICKCMDVTRKEARASMSEGFDQVETLKRYTSLGMGPCQGKTCHEAVARLAAKDTGLGDHEAVCTTVRPPLRPVSFGVLAGRAPHLVPVRRTAMHHCHEDAGAAFLNAGQWKRPRSYVDPQQESLFVRKKLGIIDVSTLGKLRLGGPDALALLHFLLPGKFNQLSVGKTRYSTMIGEDGILFEDGTLSHLTEGEYYITTTTGNQDSIYSLFWWWITTNHFDVQLANLGPVLAAVNVTGPAAREYLQPLVDADISNGAFPYMACRKAKIAGMEAWLFRIGFTGELSYEIHFPSEFGPSFWNFLLEKGKPFDIKPFGVETQRILRLEKGHLLPGIDTDALSNPYEAGVGFTIKDDKPDFVGKAFLKHFKERGLENQLVPYQLPAGAPIPDDGVAVLDKGKLAGRVTSSRLSPTLGRGIGLAWVPARSALPGSPIEIRLADGNTVRGEVLGHAAYDPEGIQLKS